MPTQYANSFEITTYEPIDTRLVLTKAEMLAIIGDDYGSGDHYMPDKYFALCSDDNCWYVFDYNATPNAETGKFTKMSSDGSTQSTKSGTASDMASALSTAKAGDKFLNTTDGKMYTAVADSSGTLHWVADSTAAGTIVYDSTSGKLKYYDGTEWKEVGSGGGIVDVDTKPSSPKTDVIYRLPDNSLNFYSSTYGWRTVVTTGANGEVQVIVPVTSLPSSPVERVIYSYDAGSGKQYKIYQDGSWNTLALTWEGTQAEYDAISTKNPSTIYFIRSA